MFGQALGADHTHKAARKCVVDLKQPGVKLSAVFDPVLITELNKPSEVVTGQAKYPALLVSQTRERFGLQYVEPGCHPVPLDWDKHKSQKAPVAGDGSISPCSQ
ncbi:hypothetical protein QQF64_023626 [Cirrhinus molitorella]|uniref:Uncharacterized protein n=1 Tax=Cirrhinus molitorella TaxID=172907 RepID=A0ABR3NJU9_9TELE